MEQVSARGHHSGIARAVEAHRQQNEDRISKTSKRDVSPFGNRSGAMSPMDVTQPNTQYIVANQVAGQGNQADAKVEEEVPEEDKYNQPMVEPVTSMSKMATVWSFQNVEPGKPTMNEPIPKGSYLDVKG